MPLPLHIDLLLFESWILSVRTAWICTYFASDASRNVCTCVQP
jgi:hypothetical protein